MAWRLYKEKLWSLREAKMWTQERATEECSLPDTRQYARFENGETLRPRWTTMNCLAEGFDVHVDELKLTSDLEADPVLVSRYREAKQRGLPAAEAQKRQQQAPRGAATPKRETLDRTRYLRLLGESLEWETLRDCGGVNEVSEIWKPRLRQVQQVPAGQPNTGHEIIELDSLLTVKFNGQFIGLGGPPGSGKSTILAYLAYHFCLRGSDPGSEFPLPVWVEPGPDLLAGAVSGIESHVGSKCSKEELERVLNEGCILFLDESANESWGSDLQQAARRFLALSPKSSIFIEYVDQQNQSIQPSAVYQVLPPSRIAFLENAGVDIDQAREALRGLRHSGHHLLTRSMCGLASVGCYLNRKRQTELPRDLAPLLTDTWLQDILPQVLRKRHLPVHGITPRDMTSIEIALGFLANRLIDRNVRSPAARRWLLDILKESLQVAGIAGEHERADAILAIALAAGVLVLDDDGGVAFCDSGTRDFFASRHIMVLLEKAPASALVDYSEFKKWDSALLLAVGSVRTETAALAVEMLKLIDVRFAAQALNRIGPGRSRTQKEKCFLAELSDALALETTRMGVTSDARAASELDAALVKWAYMPFDHPHDPSYGVDMRAFCCVAEIESEGAVELLQTTMTRQVSVPDRESFLDRFLRHGGPLSNSFLELAKTVFPAGTDILRALHITPDPSAWKPFDASTILQNHGFPADDLEVGSRIRARSEARNPMPKNELMRLVRSETTGPNTKAEAVRSLAACYGVDMERELQEVLKGGPRCAAHVFMSLAQDNPETTGLLMVRAMEEGVPESEFYPYSPEEASVAGEGLLRMFLNENCEVVRRRAAGHSLLKAAQLPLVEIEPILALIRHNQDSKLGEIALDLLARLPLRKETAAEAVTTITAIVSSEAAPERLSAAGSRSLVALDLEEAIRIAGRDETIIDAVAAAIDERLQADLPWPRSLTPESLVLLREDAAPGLDSRVLAVLGALPWYDYPEEDPRPALAVRIHKTDLNGARTVVQDAPTHVRDWVRLHGGRDIFATPRKETVDREKALLRDLDLLCHPTSRPDHIQKSPLANKYANAEGITAALSCLGLQDGKLANGQAWQVIVGLLPLLPDTDADACLRKIDSELPVTCRYLRQTLRELSNLRRFISQEEREMASATSSSGV